MKLKAAKTEKHNVPSKKEEKKEKKEKKEERKDTKKDKKAEQHSKVITTVIILFCLEIS